ncbi:MAG: hypothetical protein WCK53_02040 [Methanomicrobiales archaeon]
MDLNFLLATVTMQVAGPEKDALANREFRLCILLFNEEFLRRFELLWQR